MIAIGTTVVRALETVTEPSGLVHPGEGWTDLMITPARGVTSVDGMLTGWHEPEASHLLMLEAVAGRPVLDVSYAAAEDEGYLWHEFGDVHLSWRFGDRFGRTAVAQARPRRSYCSAGASTSSSATRRRSIASASRRASRRGSRSATDPRRDRAAGGRRP